MLIKRKHPELGDARFKKRFLFIPRRVNNGWLWLEFVTIESHYEEVRGFDDYYVRCWVDKTINRNKRKDNNV